MATKATKDVMQRDMVKLSYTDYNGRTAMVVQYTAGFSPEKLRDNRQSEEPIYVALEHGQPEELANVLQELRQYRTQTKLIADNINNNIGTLQDSVYELSNRVTSLEAKKKWYKL